MCSRHTGWLIDWLGIFYKPSPPWAVISGLNNLCFSYPFGLSLIPSYYRTYNAKVSSQRIMKRGWLWVRCSVELKFLPIRFLKQDWAENDSEKCLYGSKDRGFLCYFCPYTLSTCRLSGCLDVVIEFYFGLRITPRAMVSLLRKTVYHFHWGARKLSR